MLSVKKAADLVGLSEHTVQYYTDKGMVHSLKRDKNNNRLFDRESVYWLLAIKYLRGSGMSIKSIQEYIQLCLEGNDTVSQRYDIVISQKKLLEEKLREMDEQYRYLKAKANLYIEIMDGKAPDCLNPANWDKSAPTPEDLAAFLEEGK